MAVSQFKGRYAGSSLGVGWALVNPLLTALSINIVFTAVFRVDTQNYMLLVVSGILPWFFFSNAVFEGIHSFASHAAILRQSVFPRELIPLTAVLAAFINLLLGLAAVLPLFVIAHPRLLLFLPLVVVPLAGLFLFAAGLTLVLSTANIFHRDISHFLPVAFMIWFWVSPVFYSAEMLPSGLRWICFANPMFYFLLPFRDFLLEGTVRFSLQAGALFLGAVVCAAGLSIFAMNETHLLKRI